MEQAETKNRVTEVDFKQTQRENELPPSLHDLVLCNIITKFPSGIRKRVTCLQCNFKSITIIYLCTALMNSSVNHEQTRARHPQILKIPRCYGSPPKQYLSLNIISKRLTKRSSNVKICLRSEGKMEPLSCRLKPTAQSHMSMTSCHS